MDQQLIHEIKTALNQTVPFLFLICDTSGKIIASTDISKIGSMNLAAIKAINENRKIVPTPNSDDQDCAVPLWNSSMLGALVVKGNNSEMGIEILKASIELLYAEKLETKNTIQQNQLKDRFQQAWIQRLEAHDIDFIEQGKRLNIDVTLNHQVLVIDDLQSADPYHCFSRQLIDDHDFILTNIARFTCIILCESNLLQQKINRLLTVYKNCKVGIGSLNNHLHTSYIEALQSLEIGKSLFPGQQYYCYEQLELAINIANTGKNRQLSKTFAILVEKGHTARLAQTAVAYLQHSGNVAEVCNKLHIHRNSIQYRLSKIKELCGKDLKNYYDMLHLYASYISYLLEYGTFD